jgi:hypothetical protein
MSTIKTQMTDVFYNAAEQAFEATVTVYDKGETVSYPCAISAPITMSFEDAAKGLTKQALRRHGKPSALRSILLPSLRLAVVNRLRRGLPEGQYGFFRGRAA